MPYTAIARGIAAHDEAEEEVPPQGDNANMDEAEGISEESEEEANNDTIGLQLSPLSSPPSSHHDSPVTTDGLHQPSTNLQAMQQDGAAEMPNDDAEMETRENDTDEGGAEGGSIELDEAMLQMDDEEAVTSAVTTHTQQKDADLSMDCVAPCTNPCTNEDDTLVDDVVDEDTSGDGNEESNTGTICDDAVLPHEVVNQFDTEHDGGESLDATIGEDGFLLLLILYTLRCSSN